VIQGFSIPLPVDQQHPMPVMVSAKILPPPERPVPTPYILGKYRFETKFGPRERIRIKVRYRQQVQRENARYLLVTTRPWRRPLVRGTYRLIPNGIYVLASNYELQRNPLASRAQEAGISERCQSTPKNRYPFRLPAEMDT
jgi:hypothetical protein